VVSFGSNSCANLAASRPSKIARPFDYPHHRPVSAMNIAEWLQNLGLDQYEPALRTNGTDLAVRLSDLKAGPLQAPRQLYGRAAPAVLSYLRGGGD
jgi:hypothetical protein